ncbi:MAG TPA: 2-phosphosulfolactate phosphatase [Pirellulales bacterium]|jgi:2-phosphosulfolactate phosphatase|nr:2-phosphosulfolactate phosphatase [Pirellulales bacterium]
MMPSEIRAYFLPQLVAPEDLAGGVSVVIDVLRATTTITAALAAGAREVIPCLEVDDARRAAANLPPGQAVLGGERGGLKIDGFDLGNSPSDYTPASVGHKSLVFTTTNGTRAMLHAQAADEIWLAALVNLTAVVGRCVERKRIDLLCAGTGGKITREDVLLAGAIAARLTASADDRQRSAADPSSPVLNDQAAIARDAWLLAVAEPGNRPMAERLRQQLRETQGGRNLAALGLEDDLADAAAIDRYTIVPRFDPRSGRITPA